VCAPMDEQALLKSDAVGGQVCAPMDEQTSLKSDRLGGRCVRQRTSRRH